MKQHTLGVYPFLLPYLKQLKIPFVLNILALIAGETLGRLGNFFGSRLIGLISTTQDDRAQILAIGIFYILLYTVLTTARGVLVNVCVFIHAHYIPSVRGKLSKNLFQIIHKKAPSFFEQEMSGNIATKIRNITNESEMIYFTFFWGFLHPAIVITITFISFALISDLLSAILGITMCLYIFSMYLVAKKIAPFKRETAQKNALATAELVDSITNAETVKSFGQILFEKKQYYKELKTAAHAEQSLLKKEYRLGLTQGVSRALIQTLFCFICVLFWYYDKISIENFVFVQSLTITLIATIGTTIGDFTKFFGRAAVIQNGLDLILTPAEMRDSSQALPLNLTHGKIDVQNITFGYNSLKPIFKNFSLTITGGQKIGIVGYSGSGKSTLIKLINRFYDVTKGQILIDNQPLPTVKQHSLHAHIGIIPQEPSLFNRSILENIRYGKPTATDEEVFEATKKAFAHDFIINLPNGYESKVGERGVMLSGGERQRIAIARAILKNAPILILDEATSALDSESEKYIQKSLTALMAGKTVIAVAHRLSTLKKMDRIIVLENGKIKEDDSPEKLRTQNGIYQHLYEMQIQIQKNVYKEQ